MKEILITSSVLIVVLLILRLIFAKKVSRVLIYGAWALVALRLLIPVQIGQLDFSILTSAEPVTEAISQMEQRPVSGQTKEEVYQDIVVDYIEKDQTVFISHGDCIEDVELLKEHVYALGVREIVVSYVGPVIGAHSGPGTVALFFLGTER